MPADRAVITVKSDSEQTRVLEMKKSLEIRERVASLRSRNPRKRKARAVDIEERDEGRGKRGRCDPETERAASVNTPLLETDAGTLLQQSQDSAENDTPAEHDTSAADDENGRIQQLRDEHLRAQRPPGFIPFSGSAFEGTADAKTVLERLGFEIVEED